jgi:hypothetical protein
MNPGIQEGLTVLEELSLFDFLAKNTNRITNNALGFSIFNSWKRIEK